MKCVCPHCGKRIENGKIGFDLTGYIAAQLMMATGFPGLTMNDDNEAAAVRGGIEAVFNGLSKKDRLVFSEEEIWNWTPIPNESAKTVKMWLPFERIRNLFERYNDSAMTGNVIQKALEWMRRGEVTLTCMCFPMILEKEGDGDIRFNLIRSPLDQRPVVEERVCPECGETLSFWAGRYDEICLGILGGPRVSKTTTLTACATAFMRPGGYEGITWEGSNRDAEYKNFKAGALQKYQEGRPIGATQTTKNNIPRLSFCVSVRDKRTGQMAGKLTLTFVDLPGELNNEKGIDALFFERYAHYFENVDYLWYCTDPGELLQLRASAQDNPLVHNLGYEGDKRVLTNDEIKDNMRRVAALLNRNGKQIPVVYILGKTDSELISDSENYTYHLYSRNPGRDYHIAEQPFDIRFFCDEGNRVRNYMISQNPDLIRTLEENFAKHCYVAFSAYGFTPTDAGNDSLYPFNVTVPFMWMLALESKIQITKYIRNWRGTFEPLRYYLNQAPKKELEKDYFNLFIRGAYLE